MGTQANKKQNGNGNGSKRVTPVQITLDEDARAMVMALTSSERKYGISWLGAVASGAPYEFREHIELMGKSVYDRKVRGEPVDYSAVWDDLCKFIDRVRHE